MVIGREKEREGGGGWNDVEVGVGGGGKVERFWRFGGCGFFLFFVFFFFFEVPKYAIEIALNKRIISGIRVCAGGTFPSDLCSQGLSSHRILSSLPRLQPRSWVHVSIVAYP